MGEQMRPGDIIFYHDINAEMSRMWRVLGVFLGGEGQENLIELAPIGVKYGEAYGKTQTSCFVPETFVRSPFIAIYRQVR